VSVKQGRDKNLEAEANKWLAESVGDNKRSLARDVEKMKYEGGHISRDELRHYDPDNDWDTISSAFSITTDAESIDYVDGTADEENVVQRHDQLVKRRELMQQVDDGSDPLLEGGENVPLVGANDGRRKVCGRCKQSKGLSLFSPKADSKDGLHPWCKKCRKEFVSQNRSNARSRD